MKSKSDWHLHCSAVKRYMPEADRFSLADIERELPNLYEDGYRAIQITAPYRSAGFHPWWGLRPLDYFSLNDALGGTMEDFRHLVDSCHAAKIRVMIFINLGYADITSDLWKKACRDKKSGISSPESRYFLWSDSTDAPSMREKTEHFLQGGYFHRSEEAGAYYFCRWNSDGFAEPQYDWASSDYQAYARRILTHWLDTGIDGVIVDAVNWYLNCDFGILKKNVTDVVHLYPNAVCIPEGSTGFGDSFLPWVEEGGFDMIEGQTFHSDLHWNGSGIMDAVNAQNADLIEKRLSVCRSARKKGIVSWSYLSWGRQWTSEQRLLEIALLLAAGIMTEIIPSYLNDFTPAQHDILRRLICLSTFPALDPISPRKRSPIDGNKSCYALISGKESDKMLCMFNLSARAQTIYIDSPAGRSPLSLPAYGFAFIQI